MDLVLALIVFVGTMIGCLIGGVTTVVALLIGLVLFIIVAVRRGTGIRDVMSMAAGGFKDAFIVIAVMLVIGFVTGIWRSAGTVSFFVFYGIELITPKLFLIITFILSCLLSYALGTSFGVAGTVGVIFMTLARAGGVNPVITAGVIMSGIYFGDRNSPVSSSAILVAGVTHTDLLKNVRLMAKTGLIPWLITMGAYSFFSFTNPIQKVDDQFIKLLSDNFSMSPWCAVPAVIMVVLPLLRVSVLTSMEISIAGGILVSWLVQKEDFMTILNSLFLGYNTDSALADIINGGGMVSMIEVVLIVSISSMYSGIFSGTGLLAPIQDRIRSMAEKTGRFTAMLVTSFLTLGIFCNQTIATMMSNDLTKAAYGQDEEGNQERAIDMENSVIVVAGLIPWAIPCTVPLAFMQVGTEALLYSFLLYLIPICYLIEKKIRHTSKGNLKA